MPALGAAGRGDRPRHGRRRRDGRRGRVGRRWSAPAPGAAAEPSDALPERGMDPGAVLLALVGSPNLASRRWVTDQYDGTVQANTVADRGHGAAVLRIKATSKAIV